MSNPKLFAPFASDEDRNEFLRKAVKMVTVPGECEFSLQPGVIMFRLKKPETDELGGWQKFDPFADRQDMAMLIGMALLADKMTPPVSLNDRFMAALAAHHDRESIEAVELLMFHPSEICFALNAALFECDHVWVGRADTGEMVCLSCGKTKIE